MIKRILGLVFLTVMFFGSQLCYAQDITVVSETDDTLTIDVDVYNVKDKECVNAAIPYAYYAVFFRGFPDSSRYRNPLVGTDESFVNNFPDYFKNMENGRFSSFITTARLVDYNKKAKPKQGTVRLSLNMRALQRDLEQQGVKRRFGL